MRVLLSFTCEPESSSAVVLEKDGRKTFLSAGNQGFKAESEDGSLIESFKEFYETVNSEYYGYYRLLRKSLSSMMRIDHGILKDIENLTRDYSYEQGIESAAGSFSYKGRSYTAVNLIDFTQELFPGRVSLFDEDGKEIEAFDTLELAEDSVFYPIYATLENYKRMAEGLLT